MAHRLRNAEHLDEIVAELTELDRQLQDKQFEAIGYHKKKLQ